MTQRPPEKGVPEGNRNDDHRRHDDGGGGSPPHNDASDHGVAGVQNGKNRAGGRSGYESGLEDGGGTGEDDDPDI